MTQFQQLTANIGALEAEVARLQETADDMTAMILALRQPTGTSQPPRVDPAVHVNLNVLTTGPFKPVDDSEPESGPCSAAGSCQTQYGLGGTVAASFATAPGEAGWAVESGIGVVAHGMSEHEWQRLAVVQSRAAPPTRSQPAVVKRRPAAKKRVGPVPEPQVVASWRASAGTDPEDHGERAAGAIVRALLPADVRKQVHLRYD